MTPPLSPFPSRRWCPKTILWKMKDAFWSCYVVSQVIRVCNDWRIDAAVNEPWQQTVTGESISSRRNRLMGSWPTGRSLVQLAKIAILSMTMCEWWRHARNQSDKHMLPHHIMVRNTRQADRQKRTNFADCLLIWHIGRKHSISISERLFFLAATLDRKEARWFLRHLRGEQQSFSRSDSYVGVRWSLSPAASNTHNDFFSFH